MCILDHIQDMKSTTASLAILPSVISVQLETRYNSVQISYFPTFGSCYNMPGFSFQEPNPSLQEFER